MAQGGYALRSTTLAVAGTLAVSLMTLTNVVSADAGAGVCIDGVGFSLYMAALPAPYAGVNVGRENSTSGAYTSRGEFEAQCCAEADQEPDCFAPVA